MYLCDLSLHMSNTTPNNANYHLTVIQQPHISRTVVSLSPNSASPSLNIVAHILNEALTHFSLQLSTQNCYENILFYISCIKPYNSLTYIQI